MGTWTPGPGATPGDDTFVGDDGPEDVFGLGGNDVLNGNGGPDRLDGGLGDVITLANGATIDPSDYFFGP